MSSDNLIHLTEIERKLAQASDPKETYKMEAGAAAARAWAKEQNDYEMLIKAALAYILAKRRTTELIEPEIVKYHGNQHKGPNYDVKSLSDYGFTYMQWQRRKKLLQIPVDELNLYIDDCIEKGVEPTTYGAIKFFQDPHVSENSHENEWYTPPKILAAARQAMGSIDTDPASCEAANKMVRAETFYDMDDDGLVQQWYGNVWLNPPYVQPLVSRFTKLAVEKYRAGEVQQVCVLVNNATETDFFQNMLQYCSAICFPRGRIRYINEMGDQANAPLQGQAVLYFGINPADFVVAFSEIGEVRCWTR
jgi:hypothetical protein